MGLNTEYRGCTISFAENMDHWSCYAIEFSHEKLSKVKERIDKMHLQLRKASSVNCLVMEGAWDDRTAKMHEGKIVDYLGVIRAQRKGTFESVYTGPVVDHKVAVFSAKGNEKASRRSQKLSEAFAPEAADMLPAIHEQQEIIRRAKAEIVRIIKEMPRVQFSELEQLVRASEHVFSEGEKP